MSQQLNPADFEVVIFATEKRVKFTTPVTAGVNVRVVIVPRERLTLETVEAELAKPTRFKVVGVAVEEQAISPSYASRSWWQIAPQVHLAGRIPPDDMRFVSGSTRQLIPGEATHVYAVRKQEGKRVWYELPTE